MFLSLQAHYDIDSILQQGYNFRHRRQRTDLTASQRINHNDGFIGHWRRYRGTWISHHRSGTTRRTPRRQGIMYNMYWWLFWGRQRPKQETKRTCRWNRGGGSCSWDSSNNLYENEHGCNDGCHSVAQGRTVLASWLMDENRARLKEMGYSVLSWSY